ncbi:Hypothetical protein HDN1F_30950 [gamma proteobacterium HdN1]|nr:Hypothetical protein HDN1F_30950 [gamma proteobacterium HdN1]
MRLPTGPIARSTLRTSAVLGLRLVVQAGTLLLIARLLGPGQFGAFAGVAALAVLLGTLSTFGTHLVLLGEVSKDRGRREQVLPYAIPCTILCGSLLLITYQAACLWWLEVRNISTSVLLLVGITETLFQPLLALMVSEHHAIGFIARSQLLQLLPMVLRLGTAGLVFFWQPSQPLSAYAVGYAMASVFALIYNLRKLPMCWPSWREWRLPSKNEWSGALGYAAINITKAGPGELDKALAARLLSYGSAGIYVAGARVVGALVLPIIAMTLSALPRLFRHGHGAAGRNLLVWMYGAALIYSIFLASVLWLVAPGFNLVFGVHYVGISDVIRLLCIAIPGMALRLVSGNALMALGKPWMRVGFEAVGLATLALASVWLVDSRGAQGLPLALAFAEWGMAIVGACLVMQARLEISRVDRKDLKAGEIK